MKTIRAKKFLIAVSLVILLALSSAMLFACSENYDVTSVRLTDTPSFVTDGIEQGDNIDFGGVALEVTYSNGASELVDIIDKCNIIGFNKESVGEQIVTVSYSSGSIEKSVSVKVNVYRPRDIASVTVSDSFKTEYSRGAELDFTGAIATVVYDKLKSDGTPYTAEFSLSYDNLVHQESADYKYDKDRLGSQTLRFLLYDNVYATHTVNITDADFKSVSLATTYPTKTKYAVGDALDLTGLKLRLRRSDGVTEIVTEVKQRTDGSFYATACPDSTVYALSADGEAFDSSAVGECLLYVYFKETSSSEVLKTSSAVWLSVVEKDVRIDTVTVSNVPRLVEGDVRGLVLDGGTISFDYNDQTSVKGLPLNVTYNSTLDRYDGDGFYITGYDNSARDSYALTVHFLKSDGSEYDGVYRLTVEVIPEYIDCIAVELKEDMTTSSYGRYLDCSDLESVRFDGYATDVIDLDDYLYTVVYNSGRTLPLTSSDFTVSVGYGLSKTDSAITVTESGTSYISLSYTDDDTRSETLEIAVYTKTARFNKDKLVFTPPSRREYQQNSSDSLDLTGARLEAVYEDPDDATDVYSIVLEDSEILPYVSGFDLTDFGTLTLTVTYLDAVREFDVTVLSEVDKVELLGSLTVSDYVKDSSIDRTPVGMNGLSARLTYKDTSKPAEVITDFSDAAWQFFIGDDEVSSYPLGEGLYSATLTVGVKYLGMVAGEYTITVHNYLTAIAAADTSWEVTEGKALPSSYILNLTYEDGSVGTTAATSSIITSDYDKADLTLGARTVVLTASSDCTGGATVSTSVSLTVLEKTVSSYTLRLKSDATLPVVTSFEPLSSDIFELIAFYNNDTSSYVDFTLDLPDDYDSVTIGNPYTYEVAVLVGGNPVLIDYTPTREEVLDIRDGKLLLTVVYDVADSVTLIEGVSDVSIVEGGTISLSAQPFSDWKLRVVYKNGSSSDIEVVVDGEVNFIVQEFISLPGNRMATIVYKDNETVSYSFPVTVTEKVLSDMAVEVKQGSVVSVIEGLPLTDEVFSDVSIVLNYQDGSSSVLPLGVGYSLISVTGYDLSSRQTEESRVVNLTVSYKGFSDTLPLTVYRRSLVGIEISSVPKNEYVEKESLSLDGNVLLTSDGEESSYSYVYDNGDKALGGTITVDMLRDFDIADFNVTELDKTVVVVMTVVKSLGDNEYTADFTVRLKDRKIITVSYDSANVYEYYYGVLPNIGYTSYLDGEETSLDIVTTFYGTSEKYVYEESLNQYRIVGKSAYVAYLPAGDYTVVLSYDATDSVNAFEDSSMNMIVAPAALDLGFNSTKTYSKIYDRTPVTDIASGLVYIGFADGETIDDITVSFKYTDEKGSEVAELLRAGTYTVSLSVTGEKSFLSNYSITLGTVVYLIEKKSATVSFYNTNPDSLGETDRVYATYGDGEIALGSFYYRVEGLIEGDSLDGELLRNQYGTSTLGGTQSVRGKSVGYYPVSIGTLSASDYVLSGDFSDVYYVILPKSVTVTLGSVETVYGSDAVILDGNSAIGSIGFSSRTLVIGKTRYLIRDTAVLEETACGVIDLSSDPKTFTIGTTSYTIIGSSVRYNGSSVIGASFDADKCEITLRGNRYYYESGLIYKRVATLNETSKSVSFLAESKTYIYQEKALPEFYLTYAGLEYEEESLNGTVVRLTYKDGRLIDETTGLEVGFDVTFDGSSAYPVRVGDYDVEGTLSSAVISNDNYKITLISGAVFTITPKTVTIDPDALSKVYSGSADTDPRLTFTIIGVETADFDAIYARSISREEGESAGSYAYLCGDFNGENFSDYVFVVDSSDSFVIDKKSVTLSFESAELKKEYDSLSPSMDMTERGTFRDLDGNVWDGVDRSKVSISFHNPSAGVGRYDMSLVYSDPNHVVSLDKDYVFVIDTRKVEVAFEIEIGSDYVRLEEGDRIAYDYLKTRRIRAVVTSGVVEGENLGVMVDLDSVIDVKDNYVVTATALTGSNNYSMATAYSVTFSVVKKTVYVVFDSDDLTATYGSVSTIRDKYVLSLDEDGNETLGNNNEISYIKQYLSVTGQGTSFNSDGYVLKLNSGSEFFSNYNLVLHSDAEFLSSRFENGAYVEGHGGMRNSSLIFFVNKKTTTVSIADSYLSKIYDETAPSVISVSVDGGIAQKVKKALVYTRITGPYESLDDCSPSDRGTFSVEIDNTLLDGDAANYYCVLDKTDYVYEIKSRTVTVSFRQGEANNIYRRYNGLAPTHDDVVSTASVDYINREIYVSDYLASTDLTVRDILNLAKVKFLFSSSSADVGTYYFSVTDEDVNRKFVLGGETDSEGRLAFEVRPLVLSVTVSSEMYRYYMADDKYYLAGSEIESFEKAFEIDTEVYRDGVLTGLTLSDFSDLGLKVSLDKKSVAMRYIGSVGFNMTDDEFTDRYPNYSLPSLSAVAFTVRPSIIDVTIGNEDSDSMTYGSDISEIEKSLLLNGKIGYTLPSDVVYSGSIDVNGSLISVYDDSYYFVDGFVFFIEGHLNITSSVLSMGDDAYIVSDSLLYKSDGSLTGSSLIVRGRSYTLSAETFTDTELKSYYKVNYGSQLAGAYYPESGYIRLNGVGEFKLLDGSVVNYASCGELFSPENSLVIDGILYAYESTSGYVYRVDGRFNTVSGVFTIGSSRYIVSGERVFEITGEKTSSSSFTLDGVTYSVSDGAAYKPTDPKGEKFDSYFNIGTSSYYWDSSDKVYEIVGMVHSETDSTFILNGREYSTGGSFSYTMDATAKTITVDGDSAVYVYDTTNWFIRKSSSTSSPYTFVAAGSRTGNIISLDKDYVIVGDDIFLVEGTVTLTSISMSDFDYVISSYGYIYMDTEATLGTVNSSRILLTLGDVTYHISSTAVYTTDSTVGTISTTDREFILNNKTYVYPDSATAVIAYDLSLVRFEYYDSEDNLVAMNATTPVGEYKVRVIFDGIIENYVDNVRYTGNYTFVSDEKSFSVTKAPINVTLSGTLDWIYRESPVEGEDFSALNLAELFAFTDATGAPFDITGLYYPALTEAALNIFDALASTDVVGKSYTLDSYSFERLDEINSNYSFELTGSAVVNVVKRALTTTLVSVSATDGTVTSVMEKTYGTLPSSDELGILYTGFSDTEFDYSAVYYSGKWYVIYNYSATATVNSITEAMAEEKSLLDSVIDVLPALPEFYTTSVVEGVKYAALYSVGRNRIAIDAESVVWSNYYADTPSSFFLDVTARPLTATLVPDKDKYEIIYGSTLVRGSDYEITFSGMVESITIDGEEYIVDTPDSLFFDQKDSGYDWLVYALKVNMKNDGTSVGQPVYLTLGNSSTSKLEGLTKNYTLSYAVSDDAEICIYNKIESVMVGNGTLYSAVLSSDSYIPVRVFYLDGKESDIIKVYLNGTPVTGITLGESDGSFDYDDSVSGNQLVKISYSESNMGVVGGIDSASVFITLRKYPTTTSTVEDTSGAKEGYKKFAYYVFDKDHSFTVSEVSSHDGAIGLDYTGEGSSDITFLFAALRTDEVVFVDGVQATITSIDSADGSVMVDGTKYYLNDADGVTRLYANRNGSAPSYTYTGYAGQMVMERKVLATDGTTLKEKSVDVPETSSFEWSEFGFSLSFKPTEGQYAEIVASISDTFADFEYIDLTTLPDSLDNYKSSALKLFNDYRLIFFRIGVTQGRVIYVSRDNFATHTVVYVDEKESASAYSVGATDVFSGIKFEISSADVMSITSMFKAIDPDYVVTGGEQYAFGTKKVLDDGRTYAFTSIAAPGEYDRLRMEYSALPVQGKDGELNFVVFSYNSTDLYELSIRLNTTERAVFHVVESVNGKENLTRYEAYKDSTEIGYATMVDFFDGKVHYFDVYLNRLSNELTVIIDGVLRYTHSLVSDDGIILDGSTVTDVDFKLEDYSEWQDGDRIFYTERVSSEAYFTVKNLSFTVSSMRFSTLGYVNEMSATLIPSGSGAAILYVSEEEPLVWIDIAKYFSVIANYTDGTTIKYYVNGTEVVNYALHLWLEEGLYNLTARLYYADSVIAEADYSLFVKKKLAPETINGEEVSYVDPVTIEDGTDNVLVDGALIKDYNYFRTALRLLIADGTFDGTTYNLLVNIKSSEKGSTAIGKAATGYYALTMGVKLGSTRDYTELVLSADGNRYTLYTYDIDWQVSSEYVVIAYMDDYNHVVTLSVYYGDNKSYTLKITKDSLRYGINGSDIDSETQVDGYSRKSLDVLNFVESEGTIGFQVDSIDLQIYSIDTHTDLAVRESIYTIIGADTTGTLTVTAEEGFNSRIAPTTFNPASGQYQAIMIGDGSSRPYALQYNSYSAAFSLTRTTGVATARFIVAENLASDLKSMYGAYRLDDNFTSTRSIVLVYTDNGTVAELAFYFMSAGAQGVYKQTVYSVTDRTDARILSDGEVHTIAVNIFKTKESLSSGSLTTGDIAAFHVQVAVDGVLMTSPTTGRTASFYFPYYNSLAYWKVYSGTATTASDVDLKDKRFLNEYTMAGAVFENCSVSLYGLVVAQCDTLTVSEEFIENEVKGGNPDADNYYYFDYFSELCGLGGALRIAEEDRQ